MHPRGRRGRDGEVRREVVFLDEGLRPRPPAQYWARLGGASSRRRRHRRTTTTTTTTTTTSRRERHGSLAPPPPPPLRRRRRELKVPPRARRRRLPELVAGGAPAPAAAAPGSARANSPAAPRRRGRRARSPTLRRSPRPLGRAAASTRCPRRTPPLVAAATAQHAPAPRGRATPTSAPDALRRRGGGSAVRRSSAPRKPCSAAAGPATAARCSTPRISTASTAPASRWRRTRCSGCTRWSTRATTPGIPTSWDVAGAPGRAALRDARREGLPAIETRRRRAPRDGDGREVRTRQGHARTVFEHARQRVRVLIGGFMRNQGAVLSEIPRGRAGGQAFAVDADGSNHYFACHFPTRWGAAAARDLFARSLAHYGPGTPGGAPPGASTSRSTCPGTISWASRSPARTTRSGRNPRRRNPKATRAKSTRAAAAARGGKGRDGVGADAAEKASGPVDGREPASDGHRRGDETRATHGKRKSEYEVFEEISRGFENARAREEAPASAGTVRRGDPTDTVRRSLPEINRHG